MRGWLILAVLLLAACQRGPQLHSQESYVFGTRVEILVWSVDAAQARAASGEALREFDRLHRAYHAWQVSELSSLNEAIAAGRPAEVSVELAQLTAAAQALAARGDHLFDPGIGRLVALWGFHDDSFKARLPDPARLAALVKARPSIADLKIDGRRISSRNPAVALDFGGYLKGVALDRASAILKRHGITNALINIGGNVMALGAKGEQPWRIGIQDPRGAAPLATLELRDGEAIGTSGDYQRYFELNGHRYSHLIDPRSGRPAEGTRAVTVLISPRAEGEGAGTWSDWASKPVFIAGPRWRETARRLGLDQVLRMDADGHLEITEALRPRLRMEGKS